MKVIPITVSELAGFLNCRFEGDGGRLIEGVETITEARPEHLTFLANPRYRKFLAQSRAGVIIIGAEVPSPEGMVRLVSDHPYRDFCRSVEKIYRLPPPDVVAGIHPRSDVEPTAELGAGLRTGPFVSIAAGVRVGERCTLNAGAHIGREAVIGDDCIVGVNAVVRRGVRIGNRVVIGDGSIIGYDGFGYVPEATGYRQIPPVGTVIIEDDVHIGANCCIDRATVGVTRIRRGTKLDNLIQIAHGVEIGEHTAIAAQVGISGSTRIGSRVMMGGQAGLVGHIAIGDRMIVGAQAGVTKSFDTGGMISGYPARPQIEAKRIEAAMSRLPELLKRVRTLEDKLGEIEKRKKR